MTEAQVKAYRKNHHLPSGLPTWRTTYFSKTFPEPVVRYIMANYVGVGPTEMAGKLNEAFGTDYTVSQVNGYYRNHHLNSGMTGRFEKGHVPANKGKHPPSVGRMAETQFKEGNLPPNTKPIGYERITKDGYIEVKVKMRPSSPFCNDNFVPKHRLIWEAANGPNAMHPGIAKLVSRLVWDQETVRSSRTTRTKMC